MFSVSFGRHHKHIKHIFPQTKEIKAGFDRIIREMNKFVLTKICISVINEWNICRHYNGEKLTIIGLQKSSRIGVQFELK